MTGGPRGLGKRIARAAAAVAAALLAAVLLLAAGGALLPREVPFARSSATLEAAPVELFGYFDSRQGQRQLWTAAAPGAKARGYLPMVLVDLGGPPAGEGMRVGFYPDTQTLGSGAAALASLSRGEGVIVESVPPERVVYRIDFGPVVSHRVVTFAPEGHRTTVTWTETLEIGNPLVRYVSLFIDAGEATVPLDVCGKCGFNGVLAVLGELAR